MPAASTVFLGDSLTNRYDWEQHFSNSSNYGIDGDTTDGMLYRINTVLKNGPKRVVLMIGINDLLQNHSVEAIQKNYTAILQRLQPIEQRFILSVLPVIAQPETLEINEKIITLNHWLKAQSPYFKFTYIDLYNVMSDKRMGLKRELTLDGVHLSEEGYRLWEETIKPFLP